MTMHRWLLGTGALLSGAAVAVCLLVPLYDADDGSGGVPGATLIEVNGLGVLVPLTLFLVLAVGAVLAPSRRGRVLLVAGHVALTLLAILSIGVLFVPASTVLLLGAVVDVRTSAPSRHQRPLVPSA